jgi:hypothetical protein
VPFVVRASERAPGGAWVPEPGPISPGGDIAAPDLVLDAAGNATAVWTRRLNAHDVTEWTVRPAGGSWSGALALSDPDLTTSEPRLATDASGAVTATWAVDEPTIIQSSRRPLGSAWSSPVTVSDPAKGAERARLAVAPNGDGVAVWEVLFGAGAVSAAGLDVAGPLVSGVGVPASGIVGQSLTYSAFVSDTWSPVSTVTWNFGDGVAAGGTNPVHSYTQPGFYTVTLRAVDASGNISATTRTTVVSAGSPPITRPVLTTFMLSKTKIATDQKTKLKVALSAAATVRVVLKSKHRHSVKGKRKYLKLVIKRALPAGASKITIKGAKLKPDTWKVAGTAKNSSGTSAKKTTKLVVVRP